MPSDREGDVRERVLGGSPKTLTELADKIAAVYDEQCDMKDWEAATSRLAELEVDARALDTPQEPPEPVGYVNDSTLLKLETGRSGAIHPSEPKYNEVRNPLYRRHPPTDTGEDG